MPRLTDLTGQRFGRLVVTKRAPNKGQATAWYCQCDCGNTKSIAAVNLVHKITHSCGCMKKELLAKRSATHGMSKSLTYTRWCAMQQRCKTDPYYAGVSVAPSWNCFENFLADMGMCPEGYSLERLDNNDGYNKLNCRWIPRKDQPKNTSRCVKLKINGVELILSEWCRRQGLPYGAVRARLKRGWLPEEALGFTERALSTNWQNRATLKPLELGAQTQI